MWDQLVQQLPRVVPDDLRNIGVTFPSMPEAVLEFSHITQNPKASVAEVAKPLERDPAQTLELMRYVNSATMGSRRPISTIQQALSLIGIQRARTFVLSAALQRAVEAEIDHEEFRRQQQEAVERAVCASLVAKRLHDDCARAYLCGLMQDLMLPALIARFPEFYLRLPVDTRSLSEREHEEFGWTHGDVMAEVLRQWQFPDKIVYSTALHHRVELVALEHGEHAALLAANTVAAAIPTEFDPNPLGRLSLPSIEKVIPDFSILEIAVGVDESLDISGNTWPGRLSLCERLGDQFQELLTERRLSEITENCNLGSYKLDRPLGKGGMGTVFLAQHNRLHRPAAVKMFHRPDCEPDLIARFEAEVQLMSRLRSPYVVHVYDCGISRNGLLYYVMEYVPGQTVEDLVRVFGMLDQRVVIHILEQICRALHEAHQKDILHGDISLRNIMVTEIAGDRFFVKLLDFGLASMIGVTTHRDDVVYGTPGFVAPEILYNPRSKDARSEIYAVGAVAFYLLTGQPVFRSTDIHDLIHKTAHETPSSISVSRPDDLLPELDTLVLRCLAKSPLDRPQRVEEILVTLAEIRQRLQYGHDLASTSWLDETPEELRLTEGVANASQTTRQYLAK
ncbi:MAG: HDOD domain-containing protein [Planctomycetaceae bacterium]